MRIQRVAVCVAIAGLPWTAAAQPCTPAWDPLVGVPGVAGGYAAPIVAWDDGAGERLYLGGSFTSVANNGAARYLGKWNKAANTWSAVGGGISAGNTNAFLTALLPATIAGHPERLYVGGFYGSAGGVANSACLAAWDGTAWTALGTGWNQTSRGSIWSLAQFQGRLYAGGGLNNATTVGGVTWAGIASWDGTAWASHSSSISGFSPNVFALEVFDDGSGEALYAAGRFGDLGAAPGTSSIARWNGSSWSSVGGGIFVSSSLFGPEAMKVFDDGTGPALYVAGYQMSAGASGSAHVLRWNGQAWSAVGGVLGTGRLTSIEAFDDGTGKTLYIGGTAMVPINQIARLENGQWQMLGGGFTGAGIPPSNFPSVFGLGAWGDALYIGGNFVQTGTGVNANGLIAWKGCPAVCYPDCDGSGGLNVNDYICFQTKFALGDPYADCDQNGVRNVNDYICFQTRFALGCR